VKVIGIDYGKKGALATYSDEGDLIVRDLAHYYHESDGMIDVHQLSIDLYSWSERVVVYLEDFLVRYKSAPHIKSLRNHERVRVAAELADAEVVLVQAQEWKRALGLYGAKSKEASMELARKVFKGETFDRHDQAEAALIAHYGMMREDEEEVSA
jgi:hypothetical protein